MNYLCFSNLYLTVMVEDKLSELYCNYSGHRPYSVVLLPGAGSNRRYYRLGPDPSLIGVAELQEMRMRRSYI